MPELPEVEKGRRIAERIARGKKVVRATCMDDTIVFCDQSPRTVARRLKGTRCTGACRHGKQLWLEFDQAPALLLHFGMTGSLQTYRDRSDRPRFCKIELEFDHGRFLAMPDPRRFGRIRMRDEPRSEAPISQLGFDPLLELPAPAAFRALTRGRTVTIKGLLLNQAFAAGVGNWIADEVLYQAKIDPRRRVSELSDAELDLIRRRLKSVIAKAVEVDAEKDQFPRTWLFHHRWGKPAEATTRRGEPIRFETVAGRTTAWVPSVQK